LKERERAMEAMVSIKDAQNRLKEKCKAIIEQKKEQRDKGGRTEEEEL
jgi:hypothetical protein